MSAQYPPPPGYGQAPPPPAQQPYYPPQAPAPYPPQQQQYAQPYAQPAPQPPPQPQVDASLDDFWDQPNTGGGAGVKWKDKPDGWGFDFIVARDVTKGDIQAQTKPRGAPDAGQVVTYADGRPKLQMIVNLRVGITPEWPDGEARLFVRGQMREELARAMMEAGCQPGVSPKEGDTGRVVLAYRKPNPPLNASNIFQITYQAGPKHAAPAAAPSNGQAPAPAPQAAPEQQTQAAPPPPPQAPAPAMPQPPAQAAPAPPPPPPAPATQAAPQQPQAPAQVQSPPPPADMTPDQAQVMQTIAGGATVPPPPPAPAQG